MNQDLAVCNGKFVADSIAVVGKRWIVIAAVTLAATAPMMAQNADLQQKLAVVKKTVAQNKQNLQRYSWTETRQLNLKGEDKPPSMERCQYGPDGQVQKTPMTPPPPPPSGRRLKKRIIEKKTEEMKDYLDDVKGTSQHVRAARPAKNGASLQSGQILTESHAGHYEFHLQRLCST